jgi:heat shock protein HslJ
MRQMMRNGRGLRLALAVLALGVCVPAQAQDSPLAGTSWQLVELNRKPPVAGGPTLTLAFAADEPLASGFGGCNQFSGPYTQDGSSLSFGPLLSTQRACVDAALNTQEAAYFQALESTDRYAIADGQLVLYRGNRVLARFEPAAG